MKIRNPYHRGLAGRSQSWLGVCSLAVCFLAAGHSMAQSTWTGDTDALWSTDPNWSGTPPNSYASDSLIFNPANLTASAIMVTSNDLTSFTATSITFDNSTAPGAFTLADGSITLGGDITTTGATDAPTHSISLGLILSGDRVITTETGNNLTISGVLSNDATNRSLNKQGGGTLTLTGNNSYGGSTTVGLTETGGGVLGLGHNNALGGGTLSLTGTDSIVELLNGITIKNALTVSDDGNNKTIRLQAGATASEYSGAITINETAAGDFDLSAATGTLTVSGVIGASSGANINKEGAGTVVLSGDNSLFDKNVTINTGVLRASHNNALGVGTVALANNGAVLELADGVTISRALTVSNTGNKKILALQSGASSAEYSGAITNNETGATDFEISVGTSGTLTLSGGAPSGRTPQKTGGGTLVISGTVNNPMTINVTAGEVQLGNTNSGPGINAVYGISGIADGTTVKLTGTGGDQVYDATSGANSGVRNIQPGGTFDLNGQSEGLTFLTGTGGIVKAGTGTPTLTVGLKASNSSFAGVLQDGGGTLALIKMHAGKLTLSGENTYTGTTTVTGGVLRLDHANALPGGIGTTGGTSALTVDGGVIGLGAGDFTRGLGAGSDQVRFGAPGSGFAAYGADRIVNLGGASAAIYFNSANFFANSVTTINLGAQDATHILDFQNPLVLGGAIDRIKTFNCTGLAEVDAILSGGVTGTGSLTKAGAGTLAVTGPAGWAGNTKIDAGTLTLSNAEAPENTNPNNDASTVTIAATGATLNLTYTGTDVVTKLVIGTEEKPIGVYGKEGSPSPIIGIPQIIGDGTLTVGVVDPYSNWAGAGVAFDGDANNDGVDNGLAWLLGAANPNDDATGLLPKPTQVGGGLVLTFKMLPLSERDGANLYLEHSADLGMSDQWTSVLVPDATGGTAPVTFVVSGTAPLDVEATISPSEALGGTLFGRLKAER